MIAKVDFWIDVAGWIVFGWGVLIVLSCLTVAAAILLDYRRDVRARAAERALPLAPVVELDLSRERRRQVAARDRGRAAR